MGMNVQSSVGGRLGARANQRRSSPLMNEINVTPFVDVMLVLLIIFMVTAPLMVTGVAVDLPDTQAEAMPDDQEPLTISVTKEGDIYIQDQNITLEGLVAKLQGISKQVNDTRIFIRGDEGVAYGSVMQVMGVLNQAGYNKIALLTEQP